MQLVINTYGSYLRKRENCFIIKKEEGEFEVSAKKVESILITTSAYLSTDALKLAMDNNIDVIFLDGYGNPYGRVWHSKLGSTALIRRRQLEYAESPKGLALTREWIETKIANQIEFLQKLSHSRPAKSSLIASHVEELQQIRSRIKTIKGPLEEVRGSLIGLEGVAGRNYFSALSLIMPERYQFKGRSRSPARDEFNCMLNYGYGVLYSMVEKGCIIAGLDPYIGFLHTDNYNKKSLVFDIIEMFRILAEQTVVYLFSQRKVKQEQFDKFKNGLSLNEKGKRVLIEELDRTFEKTVRYRGRNIKNRNIIQFECHRIANDLTKGE
jgi:CRISPR-associated protein Cas1